MGAPEVKKPAGEGAGHGMTLVAPCGRCEVYWLCKFATVVGTSNSKTFLSTPFSFFLKSQSPAIKTIEIQTEDFPLVPRITTSF